ncbi:MAG: (E)-4-hydroxy-3-methylbut-2-enyl-diphosphate synthase [Acidobacteriota bacterium]
MNRDVAFRPIPRRPTRTVRIGRIAIGAAQPIAVQSMTATRTLDVDATVEQVLMLERAGADMVRIAVDSDREAGALAEIRARTSVGLVVDLQESYRLAPKVAPHVEKIRYNPGHLHHHQRDKPLRDKVAFIAEAAAAHDCAIRIGVNCGSIDPAKPDRKEDDSTAPMVESALEHCRILDDLGFTRYLVSLKDSHPSRVIEANKNFASQRPDVPLHLGVTEAGLPPEGILKTRLALEQLLAVGIGDTLRVSLTVPNNRKGEEIDAGRRILDDVAHGRFRSVPDFDDAGLNIISCPSCSRVENTAFVQLAQEVKQMARFAAGHALTIAVMGCRVNGPGETDEADLGLWCAPHHVNLKRGSRLLGSYSYDHILDRAREELERMIASRAPGDDAVSLKQEISGRRR